MFSKARLLALLLAMGLVGACIWLAASPTPSQELGVKVAADTSQATPTASPSAPDPQTGPAATPATPSTPAPQSPAAPAPTPAPQAPPVTSPDPNDQDYDPTQGPNYDPYASPQQTGGPSAYPNDHEGEGEPPPPEELVPQNPVRKVYENGKIIVLVGAERHFGHRIGDVTPVTILVLSEDSVSLSFEALQKGVLSLEGSDFELVEPPSVRILQKQNGKTLRRIDLKLQTFVPAKGLVFTADILYSLEMLPDGKTPNWKRLTTPDFVVTTSNTADSGQDLLEGDLSESADRLSWFTYPLLLAGLTGLLLWPSLLFLAWYRRVRPPKVVAPNERAWRTFDRALADGKEFGFRVKHYKLIASALRTYLGVEPATTAELAERLKDHPDLATIQSALAKCDPVLYAGSPALSDEDNAELLAELTRLVPRP